jgi:hypothetical protein
LTFSQTETIGPINIYYLGRIEDKANSAAGLFGQIRALKAYILKKMNDFRLQNI